MTKTEASLWLLFFFVAAGFGFFQGWHPEIHLSRLFGPPAVIEILNYSPVFFPADSIVEIEKQTGIQILVTPIQSWEDLHLKLVAETSANVLFIPAHWAQTLRKENLLKSGAYLERISADLLSPDFNLNASATTQDFLPLYWSRLAFFSKSSAPKMIGLPDDADAVMAIAEKSHLQKQDVLFSKMKFQFFPLDQWILEASPKLDAVLAPHLWGLRHGAWKENPTWPQLLALWGFALPKNSRLSSKLENFIRAYAQATLQAQILEKLPFASTLSVMDERPGPLEQKALYLRDLGLLKMNLIPQHEAAHREPAQEFSSLNFAP